MRIALFTDILGDRPLSEVLDWLAGAVPDVTAVELGTGGYSLAPHCNLAELLGSRSSRECWLESIHRRGFELAALNVSGNPLHPDPAVARSHDAALRDTIRLAGELGLDRIVAMSGCPGAAASDTAVPHFAGGGWLPDLENVAEWQWHERVLPYWTALADFANEQQPELRICFELHPGTYVYNTATFTQISRVGKCLAVNLDPSHFFWQSMDPLAILDALAPHIGHVHGKDTRVNTQTIALNGMLDNRWPNPPEEMPWTFATLGHGHDREWWRRFLAALAHTGFDGTIAIEHEDPFAEPEAGITASAQLLGELLAPGPQEI